MNKRLLSTIIREMPKIFTEPTYIPKLLDGAPLDSGLPYSAVLIDAHYIFFREGIVERTKTVYPNVIIDPVTYFLQFPQHCAKASFKKLPYSGASNIRKVLSDPSFRLNSLIVPSIKFQQESGATFVIAPYLCSDDMSGEVSMNNITMLGESLYAIKEWENKPKIFAPICISGNMLSDKPLRDYIVDIYKEDSFYSKIHGYFIILFDFDDRYADEEQLLGLADVTYQLSQDKDVLINHIGGFGEVLDAIGASGFISSPGGGETLSLKQMKQGKTGWKRDHNEWRYIPEVFAYVNEDLLKADKINYQCSCLGCTDPGLFSSTEAAKKRHFLVRRMQAIAELQGKSREERINLMIERLERAKRKAMRYNTQFGAKMQTAHINNWIKVLERAKAWSYENDDDELEKLLKQLD